jgi:hypothetical protein
MSELVQLLLKLLEKVPWLSEAEHEAALDLLRAIEKAIGVTGIVPPAPGSMNAPAVVPEVDPGPVADNTPQPGFEPPASPEVVTEQPEATNAFAAPGETTPTP